MADRVKFSAAGDPKTWTVAKIGTIATPFDVEAILLADPDFLKAWHVRPFYFAKAADGSVLLRYVDEDACRQAGEASN